MPTPPPSKGCESAPTAQPASELHAEVGWNDGQPFVRFQRADKRTGVVHFPEPQWPSPVVDYPEISFTLLYPTAAYAQLVDPQYAKGIWPKVATLAETLPRAYDVTGSAFAHAGPEYVHVLTESTVGGYLAYATLYHLAQLAGEQPAATDSRARACWAFAAMDLYRWREQYGRGGILAQYFGDGLAVEPEVAWDYTMFTWFSWWPLWSLPEGDPYHMTPLYRPLARARRSKYQAQNR